MTQIDEIGGDPCSCRWDEEADPPKRLYVCRFHERQETLLAEAAAFLDGLASRLERAAPDGQLNMAADDCRAMAAKLRK